MLLPCRADDAGGGAARVLVRGRMVERVLDGFGRRVRTGGDVRRAPESVNFVGAHARLGDQLRTVDDDQWTIEEHVFEANRAVIGNEHV